VAKASKARRTRSSLGWAMTPPFPQNGQGGAYDLVIPLSMIQRYQCHRIWRVRDWMMPIAPRWGRPARPGALADVAADRLA
jgi:hypothetical protein